MELGVITEVAGEHACITIWDLSTGIRLKSFKNCSCLRHGIDFISNDYIVSAQNNTQMIHVYDVQKERLVKRIVCPGKICSLAVSPDSNYCVVALQEKIYIWQLSSGNLMNVISKHYQNITTIKFTNDGSFFITCGEDNLIVVWNLVSCLQPRDPLADTDICDTPLHTLTSHSMAIQDLHVGISGIRSSFVTCSLDQTCKMFDLCTGKLICTFVFDVGCTAVCIDSMERKLFVGSLDGNICFINCHERSINQEIHVSSHKNNVLKAHEKCVTQLSVNMDGTKLLSGSLDFVVKLWMISNRLCLRTFSYKGEISNAYIKFFPYSFEKNNVSLKPSVGNFKRAVFVPGNFTNSLNTDSLEEDTSIPVILRDIDDDENADECCKLPANATFSKSSCLRNKMDSTFIDEVVKESLSQKTNLKCFQPKTATRLELLEGFKDLEQMTKEIYEYSSDYLLKSYNNESGSAKME